MKKHLLAMALAITVLTVCTTNPVFAGHHNIADSAAAAAATQRMEQIKDRLDEIKAMDVSAMSMEQRKELRAEVKAMRAEYKEYKEAKYWHGGIFISFGALIIIILLLILIF